MTLPAVASQFDTTGKVASSHGEAAIGAAATGIIDRISVDVGAHVRQGDELLHIRCDVQEAAARASEATSDAAKALAERVRNGPRSEDVAAAEADAAFAKAVSEKADLAWRRAQGLTQGVSITVAAYQDAEQDAHAAAAALVRAKAWLALLRAGSRPEDIARSEAEAKAAQAHAESDRASAAECTIRAPFDGVVAGLTANAGQYVSTALSQTLVRLSGERDLVVSGVIAKARAAELCPHQPVTVTIETPRKLVLTAKLETIQADAAPDKAAFVLRTDEPLPPDALGAQAQVRFADCSS